MIKVTVSFEQDGKRFRTLSIEGSEVDVANGLGTLATEWGAKAADARPRLDVEGELLKSRMSEVLGSQYGPDVVDRLNARMDKASLGAAGVFYERVSLGKADWSDLPAYVIRVIRQEFLSECPDFPEALLDEAMVYAETKLRKDTGL